jgi:hypothetical protein
MTKWSKRTRTPRSACLLIFATAGIAACSSSSSPTPASHESAAASAAALSSNAFTIDDFVLYAQRSITLQESDVVSAGAVGVASAAPQSFGPQLRVGPSSRAQTGRLVAPSVSLDESSLVGDVQTNSLTNHGGVPASVTSFPAAPMPLLPLVAPVATAGTNVTVKAGKKKTLQPGTYGALRVAGELDLNPGDYTFSSVTLNAEGQLRAPSGGVRVVVNGSLLTASETVIEAPTADGLAIAVAGNDDTSSGSMAATIGHSSIVTALLTAPHGTISIGSSVVATGAFAGFDIRVGPSCVVTYQAGLPPASSAGQQQLRGYVTPDIAAAPIAGPVPGSTPIEVAIGLPLRDPDGLKNLINQLYDKKSSLYGKYLTPAAFSSTYGPDPQAYQALIDFVTAQGISVTHKSDDNQLLDVKGPASAISNALGVSLNYRQRPDGTLFYAPDREPSLQVDATTVPILRIDGLDNLALPARAAGSGPVAPMTGVNTFMGYDFRKAYLPGVTLAGTGQTVALVEFDGFAASDIAAYESTSTPPLPNLAATTVFVGGYNGFPLGANMKEVTLDIEMVIAMAPGIDAVYSYEAEPTFVGQAYNKEAVDVFKAIASPPPGTPLSNQIGCSWYRFGGPNVDVAVERFAAQGQGFYQASGDYGLYGPSNPVAPPYNEPSVSYMTVVGGTQLTTDANGAWSSETTWNDVVNRGFDSGISSGGVMNLVPLPSYQSGIAGQIVAAGGDATHRNIPDVSLTATDIAIVYGQNMLDTGTSAAAPLWAAFAALVSQQRAQLGSPPLGFANYAIYDIGQGPNYQSDFHDIADNSTNNPNGVAPFSAIKGYDLATGWGTPAGAALINDLAGFVPACPPGQTLCGNTCVDETSDVHNCGACGNDCTTKQNVVSATCVGAACVPTCPSFNAFPNLPPDQQSPWLSCPGDNGACITPPSSNSNCGACGIDCSTLPLNSRGFGAVCSTNTPFSFAYGCEYPPGPNGP